MFSFFISELSPLFPIEEERVIFCFLNENWLVRLDSIAHVFYCRVKPNLTPSKPSTCVPTFPSSGVRHDDEVEIEDCSENEGDECIGMATNSPFHFHFASCKTWPWLTPNSLLLLLVT